MTATPWDTPAADARGPAMRVVRALADLEAVPDPVQRARDCAAFADEARSLQGRIAEIRRRALYEATLRVGATGRSVAQLLSVTPKAVSQAISQYRREDSDLLREGIAGLKALFGDTDPEVVFASNVITSTSSIMVAAQALWQLNDRWLDTLFNDDDEASNQASNHRIQVAFDRAEYLLHVAGASSDDTTNTQQTVPPREQPQELVWPEQVLNAMPGITGWVTYYDYPDAKEWSFTWHILSAERYTSVFDAGPDPRGWAVTEWLIWLARDFARGGMSVSSRVTSPPPYLNEPGQSLAFLVEGPVGGDHSITAAQFAESIIKTWDGEGMRWPTGYGPIDWPAAPGVTTVMTQPKEEAKE